MVNYPNKKNVVLKKNVSYSNRGMSLEEDINITNEYYRDKNVAIIHKKPTPIKVVKVDYPKRSSAVIKEAYFSLPSTTDYNGIYKGKYIDFEAKETKNKTSFPLNNIHKHQINHIANVINHGGISFLIIRFKTHGETYLYKGESLIEQINQNKKSISYQEVKESGVLLKEKYIPRIDYLPVIDELYF